MDRGTENQSPYSKGKGFTRVQVLGSQRGAGGPVVVDVQCTLLITENGIIGAVRLIASVEFSLCCRRIFGHVM